MREENDIISIDRCAAIGLHSDHHTHTTVAPGYSRWVRSSYTTLTYFP